MNIILEKREKNGVFDLRTERLYREAEDDLFYFGAFKPACEKIEEALKYSPMCVKALIMRANIAFLNGDFNKVKECYLKALSVDSSDVRILAGLANIYEILEENDLACAYVDEALMYNENMSILLKKDLIELKASILFKQKKYIQAEKLLKESKYYLNLSALWALQAGNLPAVRQKADRVKKIHSSELRLVK